MSQAANPSYAAIPRDDVAARFAVGERVRILEGTPPRHHRVPAFAKGRAGVVVRVCGGYGRPEGLGHFEDGEPAERIYRVRLAQGDLWSDYSGPAHDTLEIEIFGHWLEPA